jgi:hypothetical protein
MRHFTHSPRTLVLIAVFGVIAGMPSFAHAQASVTYSPASPKGGVTIPAAIQDFFAGGKYANLVTNDAWTYGGVMGGASSAYCSQCSNPNYCASQTVIAPSDGYRVCVAGNQGRYPDNFYTMDHNGLQGPPTTVNRLCSIADTNDAIAGGFTPDVDVEGINIVNYHEAGNQDENTLLFNGTRWYEMENNRRYYVPGYVGTATQGMDLYDNLQDMTCVSYDLPSPTLTADKYSVNSGDPVALTWSDMAYSDNVAGGGNTCTAGGFTVTSSYVQYCSQWSLQCSGGNTAAAGLALGGQNCSKVCDIYSTELRPDKSGTVTVNPTQTTTYTYTCTSPNGTAVASAKVTVAAPPPLPTASLTANPSTIVSGNSTGLTWSSTNATSCTSGNFTTGGATSNSSGVAVSPTTTTTYSITCTGAGGSATSYATVTVTAAPPDLTAAGTTVSPASPSPTDGLTFTATVSNIGTGPASNFPNVFQLANGALTATLATDAGNTITTLGSGASTGITGTNAALPAGIYAVRACANYNTSWGGSVPETNSSNNCGAWTTFTVGSPPAPDLTAGNASVTSGTTASTPVTLSAQISNIGTATATNFPNLLLIMDSGGNGLQYMTATPTLTLAPGGSATVTATYSAGLPAGNYYARACANFFGSPTPWQAGVAESNPNNNCGASVPFSVFPVAGQLTCTPSVNPVPLNTPVTFTASASGLSFTVTYQWSDPYGTPSAQGPSTSNQFTTQYAAPGSYSPRVVAQGGLQFVIGNCSPVTVGNSCSGNPAPTISASPTRVIAGNSTTISWGGSNVNTSCTITGPGVNATASASTCNATGSVQTPTINTQSTYCVVCDGNQSTKQCVTVNVAPKIIEF